MKHIAVDVRMLHSSGIGKVIENILKRMIPAQQEWKFFLLGKREEILQHDFGKLENVEIINCLAPIYSISEQMELAKKIPKNIDLFWSPHYNIPLFYTGKLIVTIHDVFHLANPQYVNGIHKRFYAKFMFESTVKKADKIICVSKFTASELKKYTHVDERKINVIYNGVDESWFHIKKECTLSKKPYLLYVGNIKPHKNLYRLLQAYQLIKDKIPHDLILVGKKDGFITGDDNIAEIANTMKDRVIFTGYVENEVLQQYFIQAEALVFPSLYEGFGLPPLEALACGCPVVVSNVASLPEICGDEVTYCNPYDVNDIANKLLNIANKKSKKRKLYLKRGNFSWDKCMYFMKMIIEEQFK